ncbi:molybdenum cofactor biosynthesis protein MoaE [Paenarthrobacter sp. CM16]|nr:molybdenum cofactor biosynthesis protein MoaE [Paenarthrobacter sp. CM16]
MATLLSVVTHDPIEDLSLELLVCRKDDGAVVSFQGRVRDHDLGQPVDGLEYQAHPRAEEYLAECCDRISRDMKVRVAAAHRVGPLTIGDLALSVAVAAAHRRAAFLACEALVQSIKDTVPIWKRQHLSSGLSEWVGL